MSERSRRFARDSELMVDDKLERIDARSAETSTADTPPRSADPGIEGGDPTRSRFTIAGLPLPVFLVAFGIVLVAGMTGTLPAPMISGFAIVMLFGGLLMWLGGNVPVLRAFGLPVILCLFLPAGLVFAGLMPKPIVDAVSTFTDDFGFLDFFVVAIVAGSILGIPRQLLLRAGFRFVVPLVGCITLTILVVLAVGAATGYGARDALMYVAAPVMTGGMGTGTIPLAEMYASRFGGEIGDYMPTMVAANVVANTTCIIVAGLFNFLGRRKQLFVGFNGHGELLRVRMDKSGTDLSVPKAKVTERFVVLAQGILVACVLLVAGNLLAALVPQIGDLGWSIVLAVLIKAFGLLPERLEEAATSWGGLATTAWLGGLLVCVSVTYFSFGDLVAALSNPLFVTLTVGATITAALTAGVLGWLVKMHFVEAAITPGLAMADTGGSGDVAVLTAADRLHLMPFAQFATRFGTVITLVLVAGTLPFV